MLNQAKNKKQQQPEPLTPEELRQFLLAELEASKQTIESLNDEQLEEVVGGYTQEELMVIMNYEGSPLSAESILRTHRESTSHPPAGSPSPITPHSEVETSALPFQAGERPLYVVQQNLPPLKRSFSAHF